MAQSPPAVSQSSSRVIAEENPKRKSEEEVRGATDAKKRSKGSPRWLSAQVEWSIYKVLSNMYEISAQFPRCVSFCEQPCKIRTGSPMKTAELRAISNEQGEHLFV